MAEKERLVEFELLGQKFRFYTGASEEELDQILTLVRTFVEKDSTEQAQVFPVAQIAVLACLNMASRCVDLEKKFAVYRQDTSRRVELMSQQITSCFGEKNE